MVNSILSGLTGKICLVYMDDILVMASTPEELLARTEEVLKRLVEFNLKLNPGKCNFFMTEVSYLGFRCNGDGISTDPSRVQKVLNFPVPKNRKQVQSWLGLANYYKKFIDHYSDIVEPVYTLNKSKERFQWNQECQKAFDTIIDALTKPPILVHPDPRKSFVLYTDASGYALGAVLEQDEKVIAYASRTLQPVERRYAAVEREILAIVWSTDHWRHFLISKKFVCYTDSKPLQSEIKKKTLRFKLKLSEFDFEIKYRKGADNGNADALSRILNEKDNEDNEDEEDELTIYVVVAVEISEKNEESYCINVVTTRRQAREQELNNEEATVNSDGATCLTNESMDQAQLCVHDLEDEPEEICDADDKRTILQAYHDSPFGGHFGNRKTYERIKRRYQWGGLKKDVEGHVKRCLKCQLNKRSKLTKMPLVLTPTASKPMERLYLDIVEGVPLSNQGNNVILSMIDDLTKFVQFEALPDQKAHSMVHYSERDTHRQRSKLLL